MSAGPPAPGGPASGAPAPGLPVLDFSAFDAPTNELAVDTAPARRPLLRRRDPRGDLPTSAFDVLIAVTAFALPLAVLASIPAFATGRAGLGLWLVLGTPAVVALLVAVLAVVDAARRRHATRPITDRSAAVARFAAANGFSYEEEGDLAGGATTLLSRVPAARAVGRIRGVRGAPFTLASVGRAESGGFVGIAVLEVELPAEVPQLLLVPRRGAAGSRGPGDTAIETLGLEERTDLLEGDFPSRFTLYAAPGSGVAVRRLLTPDVMAALADGAPDLLVETRGRRLLLASDDALVGEGAPAYRRWLGVLDAVAPQLRREADGFAPGEAGAPLEGVDNRTLRREWGARIATACALLVGVPWLVALLGEALR